MYFNFDAAGRLSTVKEVRGSQTRTPNTEYVYTLDSLDRLTSMICELPTRA